MEEQGDRVKIIDVLVILITDIEVCQLQACTHSQSW